MYCNDCGNKLPDNATFCPNCGKKANKNFNVPNIKNKNWPLAISFIPILFWLPFVVAPNDPKGKHVSNQSLLLLIASFIFNSNILRIFSPFAFPFMWILHIAFAVVSIGIVVCVIIGIVKTLNNETYTVPIIGNIRLIK